MHCQACLLLWLFTASACSKQPSQKTPTLSITETDIQLDGERVVLLRDMLRFDYQRIPELEARLIAIAAGGPVNGNPCKTIALPLQTPFVVVDRVRETCMFQHEVGFSGGGLEDYRLETQRVLDSSFLTFNTVEVSSDALTATRPAALRLAWQPHQAASPSMIATLSAWAEKVPRPPTSVTTLVVDDDVPFDHVTEVRAMLLHIGLNASVDGFLVVEPVE